MPNNNGIESKLEAKKRASKPGPKPGTKYKRKKKVSPLKGKKQTKYWSRAPKDATITPGLYITKVNRVGSTFTLSFTPVPTT